MDRIVYLYILRTGVRVCVSYTKQGGNYTILSAKTEEERDVPTFHSKAEGRYKRLRSTPVTTLAKDVTHIAPIYHDHDRPCSRR